LVELILRNNSMILLFFVLIQLTDSMILLNDPIISVSELVLDLLDLDVLDLAAVFDHVDAVERHPVLDLVTDVSKGKGFFLLEVLVLGVVLEFFKYLPFIGAGSVTEDVHQAMRIVSGKKLDK
jgi:hypothetical protein